MKRFLLALALFAAFEPAFAERRDSVYTASEQFKISKLIAPASLVGVGAICAFTPALQGWIDQPVKDWAISHNGGKDLKFDDYLQFAPLAGYGLAAVCGAGEHGIWEQALAGATAFLFMFGTVHGLKYATVRTRPNGSSRSFPSGHTATAFMGAELIRLEYGPWWGLAAYGVACTTAFFRVWNNWHWTTDLLAGAGIGILSANAAYWLLPLERKLFGLNAKKAVQLSSVPYAVPTPMGSAYGLCLTMTF